MKCRTPALFAVAIFTVLARSVSGASAFSCDSSFGYCATVETENNLLMSGDSPPFVYTSGYSHPHDGGGGVLYVLDGSTCVSSNGGSVIKQTKSGNCYYAQTFPENVEQWGADATGKNDSTTMVQSEAAAILALPANTAGVIYFPPGSFTLHHVVLPDQLGHGGTVVRCAGRYLTTLTMTASVSDDYMFATYNYANNKPEGADPVEITGCTMDFDYKNVSLANAPGGIIIEGTVGSRIEDNTIENGYQAALEITALERFTF